MLKRQTIRYIEISRQPQLNPTTRTIPLGDIHGLKGAPSLPSLFEPIITLP